MIEPIEPNLLTEREDGDVPEYHYFTSSTFSWTAKDSLLDCIETQLARDLDYLDRLPNLEVNLFRVPGPASSSYKIKFGTPQVEGVELMAHYQHNESIHFPS